MANVLPKPKKSIVLYTENYVYGGMEKFLFDIINGIDRNKYDITLLYNQNPDFEKRISKRANRQIKSRGLNILTVVPLFKWVDRRSYPKPLKTALKGCIYMLKYACFAGNIIILRKEFSKLDADVLHIVNGGYPGGDSCLSAAAAGRRMKKAKIVMSVLSYPYPRRFAPFEKIVDGIVAKNVDMILTLFTGARKAMKSMHDFPEMKTKVLYTGIKDATGTDRSMELRDLLGIPKNTKVVGTLGALEPVKGHIYFLEAVPLIKKKNPRLKYVLVGDGCEKNKLVSYAESNGLKDDVIFAGYVKHEPNEFIRIFDVFVLPSKNEGFPYAVMEAMSAGRPIVATNVGGVPDELSNGCGTIIPHQDPKAIAEAVNHLLENEKESIEMGERARKRFLEQFSYDRMITSLELVYDGRDDILS
jgi:glycosyltransferase involved in cell wall biosynthesis